MAPVARVPLDILERSTVAELLEYYAEHHPESSFTVFPGESVDAKPSHISWLEFSRATQRLARAIYPDAPIQHREVVGLLVHSDSLMWLTAITGIIRAGATVSTSLMDERRSAHPEQVFPISPRNSPVAICHILRSVSAHRLVVTEAFLGPLVYEVVNAMKLSEYDLKVHELPQLPTVYPHLAHETANDSFTPIALPPRGKALDGTTLYIHSSGSTGLPKSIPITEEVCSKFAFQSFISGVQDFDESFRE
jgi:acyl-CoA synthetase (AMP-forming)/AMP-acid ligase II